MNVILSIFYLATYMMYLFVELKIKLNN